MFIDFDPALSTEHYKQQMDQHSQNAINLEFKIKDSSNDEIKTLFNEFIHEHRALIRAEFAWFEALKYQFEPKPQSKKKFYTRFFKK